MMIVWAVAFVAAQTQKVTTPEEYDKTMKAVGAANAAMRKAVASTAFDEAKAQLVVLRQNILNAETFWVEKKKTDAQGWIKDARTKIDAVDKALGGSPVDSQALTAALKELGGVCQTCHMEYREMNPEGGFRIIPGKIGGY
jgi:cytochrome c556